jgi:hypothetical protein
VGVVFAAAIRLGLGGENFYLHWLKLNLALVATLRVSGFSTAAGLKSGQSDHQDIMPFWCSFIQAPPLAVSVRSDHGRNFAFFSREGDIIS